MKAEPVNRNRVLDRGKQLAERIMGQYWRCTLAPHNLEESRKLDKLRGQWAAWEKEALDVGIDPETEFGDRVRWLRPQKPKPIKPLQVRALSIPELVGISRLKRARVDVESVGGSNPFDIGY